MSGHPMSELPDYPKWYNFYTQHQHLPLANLAKLAENTFCTQEPISTWKSRFKSIRANHQYNTNRQRLNGAEQDRMFFEFIGISRYVQKTPMFKKIEPGKILNVADPHAPYHCREVFAEIEKHRDAECVVVSGDFADFYSKSRFRKPDHVDFNTEVRGVFDMMEWFSLRWKDVYVIKGNHDNRTEKMMADVVTTDMLWLVQRDVLGYMAGFFPNIHMVGERAYGNDGKSIPIDFLWQKGDILFTHIERSMKQSSSLMEQISNALYDWSRIFKLKPYSVIVQAHNHRGGMESTGNEDLFLVPMAANIATVGLKYVLNPRMQGRPPITGYAIFYQKNGKTDFNQSRYFKV